MIVMLPAAGAPTQIDVKSAKILTSMPDAGLKLGEVLQCIVLLGMGWMSLGSVLRETKMKKRDSDQRCGDLMYGK